MSKPRLTLIEGGKIEGVSAPELEHFRCPTCGEQCVIYPRSSPIAVQHSIPTCKGWQRVEKGTDHLEGFLTKAGVGLLLPKAET